MVGSGPYTLEIFVLSILRRLVHVMLVLGPDVPSEASVNDSAPFASGMPQDVEFHQRKV